MLNPLFFQQQLLQWFKQYGRKHLPWQQMRTPYKVWLSEIMLQQTQVNTVIPYFNQFIQLFPSVEKLANASLEEVLRLWAGLGYYARARHLHQTAQIIHQTYANVFPNDLRKLQTLPGIGRSTAGAIVSLGFNQAAPILDGNVKRVLSRLHMLSFEPSMKTLWKIAEYYTPLTHNTDYTQAMMDFGSIICIRKNPHCTICPFSKNCLAYLTQSVTQYPQPKAIKKLHTKTQQFLILVNDTNQVLLEKRPPTGIWAGLWSLPECTLDTNLDDFCSLQYGYTIHRKLSVAPLKHTFSHFHLLIQPMILYLATTQQSTMKDSANHCWCHLNDLKNYGLPAPIKTLLLQYLSQ